MSRFPPGTAAALGMACCHTCGQLSGAESHKCLRCGSAVHLRVPNSVQKTAALLMTAAILMLPANLLPIMYTEQFGTARANTIVSGTVLLWEHGSYPIALVIFIASVLIPLGKILALAWLCWSVQATSPEYAGDRTKLYRATEFIGRWSMIDVFVVAILAALIQLGGLMSIRAGSAALAFAGVVIVTMFAAHTFDSRLIWDATATKDSRTKGSGNE